MKFKIPFSFSPLDKSIKRSRFFTNLIKYKKDSFLRDSLENSKAGITREEYLGVCLRNFVLSFIFITMFFVTVLFILNINPIFGFGLSLVFSGFMFFSQIMYPRVYSKKRDKDIEKNLMPALQDMLVQLNSGIPLFTLMVNISTSDYGELSVEFQKAVRRMNAGMHEVNVLDDLGKKTTSVFFKRVIWQISNGLRAGSDMSIVINDSINALGDEQMIQIQNYGNKLNPFIVFYMLISVIIPALSVTFLTIIASIVNLSETVITVIFFSLFIFVVLIQIMFLGVIKSARPALL
ncbi:MAG: type II secretion system F family protein, partial [Minisyncoccales bacterium]